LLDNALDGKKEKLEDENAKTRMRRADPACGYALFDLCN
jgi:hypothetical protein